MESLKIVKREKVGTKQSRALRTQGLVPAIVYGHGLANESVALALKEIERAVHKGEHLVKGSLDGQEQHFLIKDSQLDFLGQSLLHVDLARVSLDERVKVTVPIVLRGVPVGVTLESGVLGQSLMQLRVECVVTAIPDEIRVMVNDMNVNDVLRVSDLKLPEGVKAMDDPDKSVATVSIVAEEVAAPAAEGEVVAAAGEPEVIGAKAEEGAEEGDEAAPKKKEDKKKEEK